MTATARLFTALCLAGSLLASAQKDLAFHESFDLKRPLVSNNTKSFSGKMLFDPVSGDRLLLVSGFKTLSVYHFNKDWKLLKKFDQSFPDKSAFKQDRFEVLNFKKEGMLWKVIAERWDGDITKEVFDMNTSSYSVGEQLMTDKKRDFGRMDFEDNGVAYTIYINKQGEGVAGRIDTSLNFHSGPFNLSSSLPQGKSKKLAPTDVYASREMMDSLHAAMLYATRRKVHFHTLPDEWALTIVDTEPNAEVIYYEKGTGRRLRSDIFSVADLLPASAMNKKFNSAFLLYGDKVYLLAAYDNGGAVGIFDRKTKKRLYGMTYNDNGDGSMFNYKPVMYDLSPGLVKDLSKPKETIEPLTMNKFCKELYKHSCGLAVLPTPDGNLLLTVGNYDGRAESTPDGRISFESGVYYISSTAGLLFSQQPFEHLTKQITYEEAKKLKPNMALARSMMKKLNTSSMTTFTKERINLYSEVRDHRKYRVTIEGGELRIYDEAYDW